MEVDEDTEAHALRPDGLVDDVGLAAPTAGGIHPDAKTDGVDAMLLENLQTIFLGAGLVVEKASLGFHLGQPANIGAFGKSRGERGSNGQNREATQDQKSQSRVEN